MASGPSLPSEITRQKNRDREAARSAALPPDERRKLAREKSAKYRSDLGLDGYRAKNAENQRKWRLKVKLKEPEKYSAIRREDIRQKRELKRRLVEHFGGKCADCQGVFPAAVFHFHHVVPSTKAKNVGHMLQGSWKNLLKEADKCAMLCANCHIMRHYTEDQDDA